MLQVLSTSLDQVQARFGKRVSTAPLHAHTVTLHNNHMIRDSYTSSSSRFHWSKQLTRLTRPNARLRHLSGASDVNNAGRFAHVTRETTCLLRYDSCLRYVTQSAKHGYLSGLADISTLIIYPTFLKSHYDVNSSC